MVEFISIVIFAAMVLACDPFPGLIDRAAKRLKRFWGAMRG